MRISGAKWALVLSNKANELQVMALLTQKHIFSGTRVVSGRATKRSSSRVLHLLLSWWRRMEGLSRTQLMNWERKKGCAAISRPQPHLRIKLGSGTARQMWVNQNTFLKTVCGTRLGETRRSERYGRKLSKKIWALNKPSDIMKREREFVNFCKSCVVYHNLSVLAKTKTKCFFYNHFDFLFSQINLNEPGSARAS